MRLCKTTQMDSPVKQDNKIIVHRTLEEILCKPKAGEGYRIDVCNPSTW
jgi:hypothetical protein